MNTRTAAVNVKSSYQSCFAANNRRVSIPTATQPPAHPRDVGSSPGNAAKKVVDQREGAGAELSADSRQVRSGQPRPGKTPLPPVKDRRRATAMSSTFMSPKKTSTSTSDKADCCELAAAAAGVQVSGTRRHQQQKQHHKKKTDTSSMSLYGGVDYSHKFVNSASGGSSATPVHAFQPPQCGVYPAATTTAPASAPLFTAVPAAGLILHGALPVSARRCGSTCQGGVMQPVETRPHQHLLVAEQPAPGSCSRLYRPGPSNSGPAGGAAGWGYAAAAPAVARPQPAVCREYLLFGPSSVLLLR